MDCCQVTTTVDSAEAAAVLAREAVRARLAACGQVSGPITSTYWWEGVLESATEWAVVFKTVEARWPALRDHLSAAHPYDTPEIVCTPITDANPAYAEWLRTETRVG